jgi:molybdopterin-guanine dinucleotide biosynthesis protein A
MTNLGPVGGIYSVIKHYQPRAVLILPVDLPLMTALALKKLKLTGELSQKACFYQDNHIPLYLPNSVYLDLFFQQAFNQQENQETLKGPSVRALLNQIPNQSIISDDPALLFNTNTPQQWQQAKSIFK